MRGEHVRCPFALGLIERFSPACAGNTGACAALGTRQPVQPRMRGEHSLPCAPVTPTFGSAPHARGTPGSLCNRVPDGRFSPACAGNTRDFRSHGHRPTVQPRMRGEHFVIVLPSLLICGSAPHARGTLRCQHPGVTQRRFSPACAGNTGKRSPRSRRRSVQPRMRGEHTPSAPPENSENGSAPHARGTRSAWRFRSAPAPVQPRMRGEHASSMACSTASSGSAPHARGTHHDPIDPLTPPRFSPACAGNTASSASSTPSLSVQPRMRGEHQLTLKLKAGDDGSAPHARGTPPAIEYPGEIHRFSPACAGNTTRAARRPSRAPVQPRMRGEHLRPAAERAHSNGSAPHARGTPHASSWRVVPVRFSPACAGNTLLTLHNRHSPTVQPRMRGEHLAQRNDSAGFHGSAPHARGTLQSGKLHRSRRRFSPACAGNTRKTPTIWRPAPVQPRMRGEHGV